MLTKEDGVMEQRHVPIDHAGSNAIAVLGPREKTSRERVPEWLADPIEKSESDLRGRYAEANGVH
jgi:hypothetical protein